MRGLAWLPFFKGLADFSRFTNDSGQIAVPVVTGARTGLSKKDWQDMGWSYVSLYVNTSAGCLDPSWAMPSWN